MREVHSPERFMCDYLAARGAVEDRSRFGIVELLVDSHSEPQIGRDHLVLAYDYDAHMECAESEFVTYGNALYESVVKVAVERHACTRRYLTPRANPPGGLEKRLANRLGIDSSRIVVDNTKQYYAPVLRFKLKLSLLTDQRQEELVPVWVDGYSGDLLDAYANEPPMFFSSAAERVLPELSLRPIVKLFSLSLTAAARSITEISSRFEQDAQRQMSMDLAQTERYFAAMSEEWQLKLAKGKFAKDEKLLEQAQEKLSSIEQQKQHHVDDIKSRYSVRCEVSLLDVVLYMVPRYRIAYTVKRGREDNNAGVLWWDEVVKGFC